MIDKMSPTRQDSMPVVGLASDRKFMGVLEEVAVTRSIFESLPIQNSVESMDINNFNAIINQTEC